MSSIYYKNQKYTGPTLDLGSGSLTTDDKTIVGAINELDARTLQMRSVTLPFTPSANGLLLARIRANTTGRAYVQLSNVSPNMADGYQVEAGFFETAHFASKGQEIAASGATNVSNQAYWFVWMG